MPIVEAFQAFLEGSSTYCIRISETGIKLMNSGSLFNYLFMYLSFPLSFNRYFNSYCLNQSNIFHSTHIRPQVHYSPPKYSSRAPEYTHDLHLL